MSGVSGEGKIEETWAGMELGMIEVPPGEWDGTRTRFRKVQRVVAETALNWKPGDHVVILAWPRPL